MGRAAYNIWRKQQWQQIKRIYIMVLKHGWTIEQPRMTQHGVLTFMMSAANEIHGDWNLDWQFHETGHRHELVRLPQPPDNEDWEIG